jgi:hypothetical protein
MGAASMKNSRTRPLARVVLAALLALPLLAAQPSTTLEGKWRLVEQRFGSGKTNFASLEAPVRLEFYVSGAGLAARLWAAKDSSQGQSWPAMLGEHPRRLDFRQVTIQPAGNLARAVYRIPPASPEGDVVEVTEEYRVVEGGGVLAGTVTVGVIGKEGPQGSYVLQRRFEREP